MSARSDERRRQIAEAALRVMQAEGYAAVTARKVAAEAGMALGHITYNFSGMDEVMAETYRLVSERLRSATRIMATHDGSDPLDQLAEFLGAGFTPEFLQISYLRLRIDLWSAAMTHPEIADTERDLYQSYREELNLHLGAVAKWNAERLERLPAVSDTIMATLDGLWLDWARRQDDAAVQRGLQTCVQLAKSVLTA